MLAAWEPSAHPLGDLEGAWCRTLVPGRRESTVLDLTQSPGLEWLQCRKQRGVSGLGR